MHPESITISVSFLSLLWSCSSHNFSALYAFGDIRCDTGNNNFRATFLCSNFVPYGRDFPNKTPTGRFSNGLLVVDLLSSALGLKNLIPPYFNTNYEELLTGVSFCSGGTGLDPLAAKTFNSISTPAQIRSFEQALQTIRETSSGDVANSIVQNALFFISAGTIDKVLYYDVRVARINFTVPQYHDFLLQNLASYIQKLYNIGARKFLVTNLPALGCLPFQITAAGIISRDRCVDQQNYDSVDYNTKFQLLLTRLESRVLPNSKIVAFDLFNVSVDVVTNPSNYGFREIRRGYCRTGLYEVGPLCFGSPSPECNISDYLFFDAINPIEAFDRILSNVGIQIINSQFSF